MSGDWSSYLIFAVIIILAVWIFSRGRRRNPNSPKLQTVMSAISLVDENLKIFQKHLADKQSTRKFRTIEWGFYKDKLDFINQESVASLNTAYTMMSEFNEKIEIARKSKDIAILQNLSFENLKEPLSKGRQGLGQWLRDNINSEMSSRRGLFGF